MSAQKTFVTTASAIISYFAQKWELLLANSDQIEADDYANFQQNNMLRFSSPPSHDEDGSVRHLAKLGKVGRVRLGLAFIAYLAAYPLFVTFLSVF